MSEAPAEPVVVEQGQGHWTNRRFVRILVLAFLAHVALIFMFGAKKRVSSVPLGPVPHLQLIDSANGLVALTDPTLFARPNAHDFVSAYWRQRPMVEQPSFERPEPPHYLNSGPADLAPAFREFVADDHPAEFSLNFKPEPAAVDTAAPFDNPVPPATTMTLSPELSPRGLPDAVTPPSWPRNDVIGPTTIQVLVDQGGNVGSAIVLKSSGDSEADQQALQLASNMRFAPAPQPTVGGITFHWHTVPANASPSKVP